MALLDEALTALEAHVSSLRDNVILQTKTGVRNLEDAFGTMSKSQDQAKAEISQMCHLQQASKDAIEEMKKVLADTNSTAKWMRQKDKDICRLKLRIQELEKAAVALTREDLLDILDVGGEHPLFDLRKVLRANPDVTDSETALSIIVEPGFKGWQSEGTSTMLFVDTQIPSISNRHVSAVTLVSSNLIQSLQDRPEATTIYFFCGHHTAPDCRTRGPQGMMRSLIAQLLRLYSSRLDFISARLRQQLEALNIRGLCECFSRLVKQLPTTTVLFCVIDSINFFEGRELWEGCRHAIESLQELVDDTELGALFLLLVTSPTRTRYVSDMFPPETRLPILGDNCDGRSRITERHKGEASRRPQWPGRKEILTSLRKQNHVHGLGVYHTQQVASHNDGWASD